MPFGNRPSKEPERYGPDTDRPRDKPYRDLPSDHPRNIESDRARGVRPGAKIYYIEENSPPNKNDRCI